MLTCSLKNSNNFLDNVLDDGRKWSWNT